MTVSDDDIIEQWQPESRPCTKIAYENEGQALANIRRIGQKAFGCIPYVCRHCGNYHIGRPQGYPR